MKIIDLLNKIANGEELPKKIKYKNENWESYEEFNDYIRAGKERTLFNMYDLRFILNDQVEILEETPKKIDKISYILDMEKYVPNMTDYNNSSEIVQKICNRTMLLEQKNKRTHR